MPRARTGTLLPPLGDGLWRARLTIDRPDGTTIKRVYSLGTTDKALARRKLAALVALLARGEDPADAAVTIGAPERVRDYAGAWLATREAQGVGMVKKERANLERHAFEAIGRMPIGDVRPSHVRSILEDAAAKGLRRNSLAHIRGVLHRMFRAAVEDELIEHNPVAASRTPKTREVHKDRCILTDDELTRFVACPDVGLETRMLSLVARCEGGMRTGDLNAWDWTMIDRVHFAECFIPRAKTKKPQRLAVPDVLAPFLRAWWERAGTPESGPVFPATTGKRAGGMRSPKGLSFAKRLRRGLITADVFRLAPHEVVREVRKGRGTNVRTVRELAPDPHDPLYFETASTLPVDFHSFRRAFASALADAGVNVQHAMILSAHSDPKVHARYVMRTVAMQAVPDAALPPLAMVELTETPKTPPWREGKDTVRVYSATLPVVAARKLNDYRAEGGNRTPDLARMKRPL